MTPQQARLRRHLTQLSAPRNPYRHQEAHQRVRDYLKGCLKELGRELLEQPFSHPVYGRALNLLGLPRGAEPSNLLVAHYDTVDGSPGADDNGSAVAVALEVARVCPHSAVLFPDLEECGLLGAQHFMESGILSGCPAVVLESVGYFSDEPNSQRYPEVLPRLFPEAFQTLLERSFRGDFLALLHRTCDRAWAERFSTDFRSRQVEFGDPLELIALAVPQQLLDRPEGAALRDFGRSDHLAFWLADRPCLMLTDSANFRNPHYHKESDRQETLDLPRMGQAVARLAVALNR